MQEEDRKKKTNEQNEDVNIERNEDSRKKKEESRKKKMCKTYQGGNVPDKGLWLAELPSNGKSVHMSADLKKAADRKVVGFPGSAHDSRVFQNSKIFIDVEDNGMIHKYFFEDYHLVGDKSYPLRKWIMTSYKDERYLDERQRYYNTIHSKTRVVVEHTFGILKSRWQILKYINVNSIEKAIQIITASCIMHNFCYVHSDIWNGYNEEGPIDMEREGLINMEEEGIIKREDIANNLWRDKRCFFFDLFTCFDKLVFSRLCIINSFILMNI
ncbi:hypothetical protein JTB14_009371 [Gonioctena quinquepunctata]|nr:hypothetical protein JTB14_009371 [Gonioctena quinquepunctata]